MPCLANERKESKRDRRDHECAAEDDAWPEPVRESTAHEAGGERGKRSSCDDEPGNPERKPAHVVQVNDQKRPDNAVTEHVRQPASLQNPDVPRELRIEAAKVGAHDEGTYRRECRLCRRSPQPLTARR
ncbi:MAG: hypothetical protein QOE13_323 [Gaiellaceae bacterium]|nr:hypothetical protein [Gaiellaceae bacterium]